MQQIWTVLQHDGPNHLGLLLIQDVLGAVARGRARSFIVPAGPASRPAGGSSPWPYSYSRDYPWGVRL